MLAAEIVNSEDLESNIREELGIYDGGALLFKQDQFGEVTKMHSFHKVSVSRVHL